MGRSPLQFIGHARDWITVVSTLLVFGLPFSGLNVALSQQTADADKQAKIDSMRKELDDAVARVKAIVNQTPPAVKITPGMKVATSQGGWFHEGATKPHYLTVDVRQTQELPYANRGYITSDLNPGIAFIGSQLEFNSMTKYFYTDRTLPKKKLTEAQMLEINRLYRIIGDLELKLGVLERPPPEKVNTLEAEQEQPAFVLVPPPRENYTKAAIGVAIVLVLYVLYRMLRKLRA
ncbi:MAG TPA: hypothetical protein PKA41_11570 [Verrucomicrobiota bacterium]|nr:hypothetical protein [Verrucomicrobiota bacterium]